MTAILTIEQLVGELREMLTSTAGSRTLAQRLGSSDLVVLYELREGTDAAGEPLLRPHVMRVSQQERSVAEGAIPYDEADIVIRAAPATLHRLTSGELNGREAIVSGALDIRKAPSLPKLLLMRGLFNQHKKNRARGAGVPVPDSSAAPDPSRYSVELAGRLASTVQPTKTDTYAVDAAAEQEAR